MGWSDFEIPQLFVIGNSKKCMNFNTGCATNVSFQKVSSNCSVFKQALENRPNEFLSICVSKDVATKIF